MVSMKAAMEQQAQQVKDLESHKWCARLAHTVLVADSCTGVPSQARRRCNWVPALRRSQSKQSLRRHHQLWCSQQLRRVFWQILASNHQLCRY